MKQAGNAALKGLIAEFLVWLGVEKGLSENTVLSYGYDLEAYRKFVEDELCTDISKMRRNHILDYLFTLQDRKLSPRSI